MNVFPPFQAAGEIGKGLIWDNLIGKMPSTFATR